MTVELRGGIAGLKGNYRPTTDYTGDPHVAQI
jgi:hypothetical protein